MQRDRFRLQGAVIDERYRVDQAVGEGGFGVVYRGFHLRFNHPIAVKCLKVPAHFTEDAERLFLDRFREEGAMVSRLAVHPALVRVFDFGVTTPTSTAGGEPVPFLVLEWLEGRPLDEWLAARLRSGAGPLRPLEAVELLFPAVDALALAHEEGIAHRDIKPANLFVVEARRGRTVKVLDFGVAKAIQDGESATRRAGRTGSGFGAFSVQHGAPEQFWPGQFGPTGRWTDVHGLGLLLVELVTGRPAYDGAEPGDFFAAATGERRPTPRARGADVPAAFESLCAKALALAPAERFPSARELLEAMDAFAAEALGEGRRSSIPWTPPAPPAQPEPADYSPHPLARTTGPTSLDGAAAPIRIAPPPPRDASAPRGAGGPWAGRRSRALRAAAGLTALGALGALALIAGTWAYRQARGPEAPSAVLAAAQVQDLTPDEAGREGERRWGRLVKVSGGSFLMGSNESEEERPAHEVLVAPFEIDLTEVTVEHYRACVDTGRCTPATMPVGWGKNAFDRDRWAQFCNYERPDRLQHPINCVDHDQAEAFCRAAGKRLPTEEEWEYAARGGASLRPFPWGASAPDARLLNACGAECVSLHARLGKKVTATPAFAGSDGWETTAPVGSFPDGASSFGALDMAGNVAEWTSTRHCPYESPGCSREARVIRGGGWRDGRRFYLRASARSSFGGGWVDNADVGFRCARSLGTP